MVLSGVFELRKIQGGPRETFTLAHPQIPDLILARVTLTRQGRDRYYCCTRALYYVNDIGGADSWRQLSALSVFGKALRIVCSFPVSLESLKQFVKGILRRNRTDFEDVIALRSQGTWSENVGREVRDAIEFDDGSTVPTVTKEVRLSSFASGRLALYAHHDVGTELSPEDVRSLQILKDSGFDVVVISTSLGQETGDGPFDGLIIRPNVGHDFMSWKIGLERFANEVRRADVVVLTNNSMVISGDRTVRQLVNLRAPFVCLTDSHQVRHHAESVWWQFQAEAVPHVEDFFSKVVSLPGKQAIIKNYEIGMTGFLEERGYSVVALWAYEHLVERLVEARNRFPREYRRYRKERTVNPSKHLSELLRSLGVDLLKKPGKLNVA